ncbi:hypothetical protein [Enterovibrio baiacu]|uniref:hypothetical protein n=1 Tax=Enterovibrio baiacu TaxID=2491023 RepID=UPI0010117227|nr:hypothetical protein [Enterovibrio baiacu]MBE1274313.1 hypothetical protein [Enterovibrio baiacu]
MNLTVRKFWIAIVLLAVLNVAIAVATTHQTSEWTGNVTGPHTIRSTHIKQFKDNLNILVTHYSRNTNKEDHHTEEFDFSFESIDQNSAFTRTISDEPRVFYQQYFALDDLCTLGYRYPDPKNVESIALLCLH